MSECPLCSTAGQDILWSDDFCRVILADEADYPGFCRVILNQHVKEMTDLPVLSRQRLMITVLKVEDALRELLNPDKVNLASLGNVVPHLHWHVIPRFADDSHFPDAIWAPARRTSQRVVDTGLRSRLVEALTARLQG